MHTALHMPVITYYQYAILSRVIFEHFLAKTNADRSRGNGIININDAVRQTFYAKVGPSSYSSQQAQNYAKGLRYLHRDERADGTTYTPGNFCF